MSSFPPLTAKPDCGVDWGQVGVGGVGGAGGVVGVGGVGGVGGGGGVGREKLRLREHKIIYI